MENIKAVIFDLDGTLINSIYDLADGVNYALSAYGYPLRNVDEFYYFVGDGAVKMIERALPDNVRSEAHALELREKFLKYYSVHSLDKTKPYDGIVDLILFLKKKNIKTAVVTNKPDREAKAIVNKLFGNMFDLVFGQRDGVAVKPDPQLTLLAMKELNVSPGECIFVGDSGVDILTGVNSGAYPVGVLWGFREESELKSNGAKTLISKPNQLLEILGEF